jgi:hypothetical protein
MKGRQTSYQRFGSALGTNGSVVNKFFRSLGGKTPNGRDSELFGTNQMDMSDNKGIYNKTLKSDEYLQYDIYKEDLGEEVYGCIARPFGKESGTIETDSSTAIKGRQTKRADSPHFETTKREWHHTKADETYEDCALIPQENIPLVVNSKFEMTYWDEIQKKVVQVPKGTGFTSGALVRPIAFSDKATKLPDGAALYEEGIMYACKLNDVPIKTAHAILNRCKEISLTGSVDIQLTRKNKRCDGPETSTRKWTAEMGPYGCPPGECKDTGGEATTTCISQQKTTVLKLAGDIEMTAYRHKQLSDIWIEPKTPKTLDLSGNYFYGSLENGAFLRKIAYTTCELTGESGAEKLIPPTIEKIAEFEKQTKLSSGCLVYPETNASILLATQANNLKSVDNVGVEGCTKSPRSYWLELGPISSGATNYNLNYLALNPNVYAGGAKNVLEFMGRGQGAEGICPLFVSGPSLRCDLVGSGWDFTKLGNKGPEEIAKVGACLPQGQNFPDMQAAWKSTGIKKTIVSGECELGLSGIARYDRTGAGKCECDSSCEECTNDYGKLDLGCNCTPLCVPEYISVPFETRPCVKKEFLPECDGTYNVALRIGKYIGAESKYQSEYLPTFFNIAPVPLSTKSDTGKEDLTLFWNGYISDRLPQYEGIGNPDMYNDYSNMALPLLLNEESAKHLALEENTIDRWDVKEVGTLIIKCEDWATEIPIWTVLRIAKENTCTGPASYIPYNTVYRTVTGTPLNWCKNCQNYGEECCGNVNGLAKGCGGIAYTTKCCKSEFCNIDDPCGMAWTSNYLRGGGEFGYGDVGGECDDTPSCNGTCSDEPRGCCGCIFNVDCPPYKKCAPYVETQPIESLGCYDGSAHEEDKYETKVNLTLEFKLFEEME